MGERVDRASFAADHRRTRDALEPFASRLGPGLGLVEEGDATRPVAGIDRGERACDLGVRVVQPRPARLGIAE